jgi:1,4-dihydroxy-2-naphthoate octaprenyltransferase
MKSGILYGWLELSEFPKLQHQMLPFLLGTAVARWEIKEIVRALTNYAFIGMILIPVALIGMFVLKMVPLG